MKSNNELPTVAFLLKKIHSSPLICNQLYLECSGEWLFHYQIMDSRENIETSNSFVVATIKKTSWGGYKKFEDIAFENTQTFSVLNGKIYLVPFNDCGWEESVFGKVMFTFSQGNTISISRSINKCKTPSIFENFLVLESFFWSNYRLIVQSSNYILKWLHQECVLGNLRLGLFRSSRPQPSTFENLSRKYRWWSHSFG